MPKPYPKKVRAEAHYVTARQRGILLSGNFQRCDLPILLTLATFCDQKGLARPAVTTLARCVKIDERSARRALRRLEAFGAIIAVGSRIGGRLRATFYRITAPPATAKQLCDAKDDKTKGGHLLPPLATRKGGRPRPPKVPEICAPSPRTRLRALPDLPKLATG